MSDTTTTDDSREEWREDRPGTVISGEKRSLSEADREQIERRRPPGGA